MNTVILNTLSKTSMETMACNKLSTMFTVLVQSCVSREPRVKWIHRDRRNDTWKEMHHVNAKTLLLVADWAKYS